jgi:hypothetical protein
LFFLRLDLLGRFPPTGTTARTPSKLLVVAAVVAAERGVHLQAVAVAVALIQKSQTYRLLRAIASLLESARLVLAVIAMALASEEMAAILGSMERRFPAHP